MKNVFKIGIIFLLVFHNLSAQNNASLIKIDTLCVKGKISSNIQKLTLNFPMLCCSEEYDKKKDAVLYNPNPILKEFGLLKSSHGNNGIRTIITAAMCNKCDEAGFQVVLYEFSLQSENHAKKLYAKIDKINKKETYAPFGKNWFYRRIRNKVYFIHAFVEDEINKTKIELIKRIDTLK